MHGCFQIRRLLEFIARLRSPSPTPGIRGLLPPISWLWRHLCFWRPQTPSWLWKNREIQHTDDRGNDKGSPEPICASRVPRNNGPLLPIHADPLEPVQPCSYTVVSLMKERDAAAPAIAPPLTSSSPPSICSESTLINCEQPSHIHISGEIRKFVAVTSIEFERYQRNVTSERYYYASFMIPALDTKFSAPTPPHNWVYHVHPEGAPYFHDSSRQFPILTDVYIYDQPAFRRLEIYIDEILVFIDKHDIVLPGDTQLVLEFRESGNCGYYFVDHGNQSLFWLEEFDAMVFLDAVKVKYSRTHIGLAMKSLYWCHNMLFPDFAPLAARAAAIVKVKDVLIHTIGDTLTSSTSTTPFSRESAEKLLPILKEIEGENTISSGSASILYRLLQNIYNERFLNLYGEQGARLDNDHSIHPQRKRPVIMKLLSPVALFGLDIYYEKLRNISIDSFIQKSSWDNLKQEMTAEWNTNILYATVLLNANVAFLAIQSVDTAPPHQRTFAQRASYLSIVNSLGAITVGLLLIRQHNTVSRVDRAFLVNRSASIYGLETLAFMYSLPYSLLMWGMVSFLGAFSLMCFSSHDMVAEIIMCIAWFMAFCLIIWCILVKYENTQIYYPWPLRKLLWWRESMYQGLITLGKGVIPASI